MSPKLGPIMTSTPSRPPGADPRLGRGAGMGGRVGGRFVLPDRPFTMGTRVFHTYPGGGVPLKLDPRGMGGWRREIRARPPRSRHPSRFAHPPPPRPHSSNPPALTLCTPGSYGETIPWNRHSQPPGSCRSEAPKSRPSARITGDSWEI